MRPLLVEIVDQLGLVKQRKLLSEPRSVFLARSTRVAPVNRCFNLDLDVPQLPFQCHALITLRGHSVPPILNCPGRLLSELLRHYTCLPAQAVTQVSDDSAIDPLAMERDNHAAFNKIRSMTDDLREVEDRERDIISGINSPLVEPNPAESE